MPVWLIVLIVWCVIGAIIGFKESPYFLAPIGDAGFFWVMVLLGPIGAIWVIKSNHNAKRKMEERTRELISHD